jgi:hypothetical protein
MGGIMSYAADGALEPSWVNDKYDCICEESCDMCDDEECDCEYHEVYVPSLDEDYFNHD